jgi:hypothetical protein
MLPAAFTTQACPAQLLEPQWSVLYNATTKVMFALLGDKATAASTSTTWADSRDMCRSFGPGWDMAYYDSFQQQYDVENSYMFNRNVNPASFDCYYMGYYSRQPLASCPAGSVYPNRYSCFFSDWSNWAVSFERADGISGTTSPYPIKQGNGTYMYTWWASSIGGQTNLDRFGGEPSSGTGCVFAYIDYRFSSFNGTSWNATRTYSNYINYRNRTAPDTVWGWADADDPQCTYPCRVLCRGTCVITGECWAMPAGRGGFVLSCCRPLLIGSQQGPGDMDSTIAQALPCRA